MNILITGGSRGIGRAMVERFSSDENKITFIKLFGLCQEHSMPLLSEMWEGEWIPSKAFAEGGIHEAIACYEDTVFYQILAEELSRRDMDYPEITEDNYNEIVGRMERYMEEFTASGVDHLVLDT